MEDEMEFDVEYAYIPRTGEIILKSVDPDTPKNRRLARKAIREMQPEIRKMEAEAFAEFIKGE